MKNNDVFVPGDNDSGIDYDPLEIKDRDSFQYGFYIKLRSLNYYYNETKTRYKVIAATWFLAAFIAFDYLLAEKIDGLIVDKFLGIFSIGLAATFGVLIVAILDLGVSLRQSEIANKSLKDLESKHSYLCRTYHNLEKLLTKKMKRFFESLFYAVLVVTLLLISNISLTIFLKATKNPFYLVYSFTIFLIMSFLCFAIFFYSKKASENI